MGGVVVEGRLFFSRVCLSVWSFVAWCRCAVFILTDPRGEMRGRGTADGFSQIMDQTRWKGLNGPRPPI